MSTSAIHRRTHLRMDRFIFGPLMAIVTVLGMGVGAATAGAGSDTLYGSTNDTLYANGPTSIFSPSRTYEARLQTDGNFVLYGPYGALWASNSHGDSNSRVVMQSDGNFVLYDGGSVLYATGSRGTPNSRMVLQGDGNLVIHPDSGGSVVWSTNTYKQACAMTLFPQYGWGADQYGCLNNIWTRESGWNELAQNPSSPAYGIPQANPGSKMATFGSDWRTNPQTQIRWGEKYIATNTHFKTPCQAWTWWQAHGSY